MSPYLAGGLVVVLAATHWGVYEHGKSVERGEWKTKVAEQSQAATEKYAALESQYRAKEKESQDNAAKIGEAYEKGRSERDAEYDRTIADLNAGNLRLRKRFQSCPASGVPGAGAGSTSDNAAQGGGLSKQDQEFLIRIGREADEVAGQLASCQAQLKKDRE